MSESIIDVSGTQSKSKFKTIKLSSLYKYIFNDKLRFRLRLYTKVIILSLSKIHSVMIYPCFGKWKSYSQCSQTSITGCTWFFKPIGWLMKFVCVFPTALSFHFWQNRFLTNFCRWFPPGKFFAEENDQKCFVWKIFQNSMIDRVAGHDIRYPRENVLPRL